MPKSGDNPSCFNTKKKLPTGAKVAIGVGTAVVAGGAAVVAAPFVVAAAGVGSVGVAAGSLAASFMSWSAVGLGAAGLATATAVGASAGGAAGLLIANLAKRDVSYEKLRRVFKQRDRDEDGKLSFDELLNALRRDLELELKEEEVFKAYVIVTGREKKGSINFEEFLKMFGKTVKLHESGYIICP